MSVPSNTLIVTAQRDGALWGGGGHSQHVWLVRPRQSMHTLSEAHRAAYSSRLEHTTSPLGMWHWSKVQPW